jgi:cobyrinic acid a,c-diamide synthase
MKTVMITAPNSGSGKTTITMGIVRSLKNMGLNISCLKTGPDYIDTAFLEAASGRLAGNLDVHLQGEDGIFKALSFADSDYCVIEGAMGYFDGIYNTYENSSYDISRRLSINSILIYTPKGEMFSAIPKIKGMEEFKDSNIKGVILNKVVPQTYKILKEQIEKYTNLKVLGFIPPMEDVELKSRHLGLVQSLEVEDIDKRIEKVANAVMENVDLKSLINLMVDVKEEKEIVIRKRNIRTGVARDKAFSFYYRENLRLLEKSCDVVYFSPIEDEKVPECDLLYLGGGYPEVFKEELSNNNSMLSSIKDFADSGGCIYAECGGFMYLTQSIEGFQMTGVFEGYSYMTTKLQRFGYIDITLNRNCILGKAGDKLTAHEFHKSITETKGQPIYDIKKTMGDKTWNCGYTYKNVIAGYPHINFLGNMKAFENLLNYVERSK